MKTTKSIMSMVLITAMSAVLIIFSACEKDKDSNTSSLNENSLFDSNFDREFDGEVQDQNLNPLPASAAIDSAGEVKTFRVSGGKKPYTWAVSKAAAGSLDRTTTANEVESVKYTAAALAANTIIVTDAIGRAAVIDITAGSVALAISPTTITFLATELGGAAGRQSVQFSAIGGVSTYTWSDSLPAFGSIDGNGLWISANQSVSDWSNKVVTITLQDSNGDTATATITAN